MRINRTFALTGILGTSIAFGAVQSAIPVADNTLYQDLTGSLSNGSGGHLFAGTTAGASIRRFLLRFDLPTSLPAGSTINSATIRVNASRPTVPTGTLEAHRALASWGEGASDAGEPGGGGAAAAAGDATWLHRNFPGTLWAAEGGDFAPAISSSVANTAGLMTLPSTSALVADLQGWHDGTIANHGWLFKLTNDALAGGAVRYESREWTTASQRPTLTVNFRIGGDASNDDRVDLTDFSLLAANFGGSDVGLGGGDFNRDGTVDLTDFSILAANFGINLGSPRATVPEPTSAVVLAGAAVVLARRRRA